MIGIKAIKLDSDPLNLGAIRTAVRDGMWDAGKDGQELMERGVRTWSNKPTITISRTADGVAFGTDDPIYGYVNDGTKAHTIAPKRGRFLAFGAGGRAKTQPGVVGSGGGARGDTRVFARVVRHPGTKARGFTKVIARQMGKVAQERVTARIASAVGNT